MRLAYFTVFLGMTLAIPMPQVSIRNLDADDLVHNSWSARAVDQREAVADADGLVHNSWSARTVDQREAAPDADDLVHNSWSAKN
ncbi:hypothetical protein BKA67DRAFT_586737 [Truncatella angustata]|uniref:Uncharacterized protein n=1 Tax=Truncatella angustata TaxID=152316 RepID=A0A9P8RKM6_9PEZI|nr:uncharacterized protein BKA67DRAFT_586737 [Truncatella angustata]KAH6645015.1 hypothetical protein BKA67DRAFT_586737 [Truncatella angustata]